MPATRKNEWGRASTCPECKAPPGEPCVSLRTGLSNRFAHSSRPFRPLLPHEKIIRKGTDPIYFEIVENLSDEWTSINNLIDAYKAKVHPGKAWRSAELNRLCVNNSRDRKGGPPERARGTKEDAIATGQRRIVRSMIESMVLTKRVDSIKVGNVIYIKRIPQWPTPKITNSESGALSSQPEQLQTPNSNTERSTTSTTTDQAHTSILNEQSTLYPYYEKV